MATRLQTGCLSIRVPMLPVVTWAATRHRPDILTIRRSSMQDAVVHSVGMRAVPRMTVSSIMTVRV